MVDVADKTVTSRTAIAKGEVRMQPATLDAIRAGNVPKGDVLAAARIAGIMAAKRTPELIPLCHTLLLSKVAVDFAFDDADKPGDDYRHGPLSRARQASKWKH